MTGFDFASRIEYVSGNKVLTKPPKNTLAKDLYRPKSGKEISNIVSSLHPSSPIACLCGGHEASNTSAVASKDAVLLDFANMKSIDFRRDVEGELFVTVGAGVLFRELVEALKEHDGALPVGTGATVGVVGYLTNGGISGYFSRRLGLLGQRVEEMTVVIPETGELRMLHKGDQDPLFTAMLGAGSAVAIIVDVTIRVADARCIKGGEQRVFLWGNDRSKAVKFAREGLNLFTEKVLPDDSASMELVVSASGVLVLTAVYYDTFHQDNPSALVKQFEDISSELGLEVVASNSWDNFYDIAAALWPVISAMEGDPLALLQHSFGTPGTPAADVLDFICDKMIAEAPLDVAEYTIVEIRTLGGAISRGPELPSGNYHHDFFVDLIPMYNAGNKTTEELQSIVACTNDIMNKAQCVNNLAIDFSGTHSQADDNVGEGATNSVDADVIFGSSEMANKIRKLKQELDPRNKLRFHPYAKFLS